MAVFITPEGLVIPWRERYPDSLKEQFSSERVRAVRVIECDWENRWPLIREWLGYPYLINHPNPDAEGVKILQRQIPQAYPILSKKSGRPWLYATDVLRAEGVGAEKGFAGSMWDAQFQVGKYEKARIWFSYEALPYVIIPDEEMRNPFILTNNGAGVNVVDVDESSLKRYVTRIYQPGAKRLDFPRGALRWESDNRTCNQTISRTYHYIDFVYIWHQVPGIPEAIFSGALDTVNDAEFDERPAGTLHLLSAEMTPKRLATGQRVYDMTYKIRYFNPQEGVGHQHALRFKGATLDYVYDVPIAGETKMFRTSDFKYLFRGPFFEPYGTDW